MKIMKEKFEENSDENCVNNLSKENTDENSSL